MTLKAWYYEAVAMNRPLEHDVTTTGTSSSSNQTHNQQPCRMNQLLRTLKLEVQHMCKQGESLEVQMLKLHSTFDQFVQKQKQHIQSKTATIAPKRNNITEAAPSSDEEHNTSSEDFTFPEDFPGMMGHTYRSRKLSSPHTVSSGYESDKEYMTTCEDEIDELLYGTSVVPHSRSETQLNEADNGFYGMSNEDIYGMHPLPVDSELDVDVTVGLDESWINLPLPPSPRRHFQLSQLGQSYLGSPTGETEHNRVNRCVKHILSEIGYIDEEEKCKTSRQPSSCTKSVSSDRDATYIQPHKYPQDSDSPAPAKNGHQKTCISKAHRISSALSKVNKNSGTSALTGNTVDAHVQGTIKDVISRTMSDAADHQTVLHGLNHCSTELPYHNTGAAAIHNNPHDSEVTDSHGEPLSPHHLTLDATHIDPIYASILELTQQKHVIPEEENIYETITDIHSVLGSPRPPQLPERNPQVWKKAPQNGRRRHRVRCTPHIDDIVKDTDIVDMDAFHVYTVKDVMESFQRLSDDIPDEEMIPRAPTKIRLQLTTNQTPLHSTSSHPEQFPRKLQRHHTFHNLINQDPQQHTPTIQHSNSFSVHDSFVNSFQRVNGYSKGMEQQLWAKWSDNVSMSEGTLC